MSYKDCLEVQYQVHREIVETAQPGVILSVEHLPVITLGKHANQANLLWSREWLNAQSIDLCETDRGGEVTAHEPGQLVVYPILRLSDFQLSPRKYVALLEDVVISTLLNLGISSAVDPERPGVWVGSDKICAIGVRIKDRVSMHGIALNISNSLRIFDLIVPCGLVGRGVTSMARLSPNQPPELVAVRDALVSSLVARLEQRRVSV
jgi:lipoate-protein ligase B